MKMIRLLTILLLALFMVAGTTIKRGPGGGGGSGEDVITIADPGTEEALYILGPDGKLIESPCTIERNGDNDEFGTISCPDASAIGGNVFSMHEHAHAGQNTTCADREEDQWGFLDVDAASGSIEVAVCIDQEEVARFTSQGLKAEDIAYPAVFNASSEVPGDTLSNVTRDIIYVYDEDLSPPDIGRIVENSRVAVVDGSEYGAGGKTSHAPYRSQVTYHVGTQGRVMLHELISAEGDPTVYTAHNRQVGGNTKAGDEGPDILRGFVSDIGTVVPQGTIVNGIDPTDTAVSVTGLNETASRYVGAGTYMVFPDTAVLVDIVSNDGSGGYVLGSGEADGTTDKCFAPVNEDITINGVTTNQYFRIIADDGDDGITTEWEVLGTDKGQPPNNYTVTTGTDAGRIVDCEWIRGVIDSDGVEDGEDGPTWEIILIESAAHTLAADEPFQVTPYGIRRARGIRMIVQNSIGSDGAAQGFQANCRIEVDGREARCGTAFEDAGSGPLTSAGYYFDLGVDIDNSRRGYRFRTSPDLTPFQQFLVLDVDDDDWTNEGDTATVVQVTDDTDLNLGVSAAGWKIGTEPLQVGSVPGMQVTTATDRTLRWIYDQTHFPGIDTADWTTFYLSSEAGGWWGQGSDSNDGLSPETALQTIPGLFSALRTSQRRVEVVLDPGDTWTCTGSPDCSGTDSLGPAFSGLAPACADGEPCILVRGADRTGQEKPTLDCGDVEDDSAGGPTQALLRGGGTDSGWVLYENLALDCDDGDDDMDLVRPDDGQWLAGLGLDLRVAGLSDQMATGHGDGVGLLFNTTGFVADDGTAGESGAIFAPVNNSTLFAMGNTQLEFRDTDVVVNDRMLRSTVGNGEHANLWVIGHLLKNVGATTSNFHGARVGTSTGVSGGSMKMVLAKMGFRGLNNNFSAGIASAGVRIDTASDGGSSEVEMYQVTMSDMATAINVANTHANSTTSVTARCILADGLNNAADGHRYTVAMAGANDLANTTWDVQMSAYDDDEGGSSADCSSGDNNWYADGTGYQCLEDPTAANPSRGLLDSESVVGTLFDDDDSVEIGGVGTNVNAVAYGIACDPQVEPECYEACTSPYTVAMPVHPNSEETIAIPREFFGAEIRDWRLNTSASENMGAR